MRATAAAFRSTNLYMLGEHEVTRMYARLAALLLVCSCTRPNPRDCADGLCTDPAYPFCDIDGALAGEQKACIAVSCTPNEFEACRGDTSIVCNAVGNDYELVKCEKGCDAEHGCRACTTSEDCRNPTPVCDADGSACRACRLDDECRSAVCDEGACLPEVGILYVLPNGSDTSDCARAQPCSMLRANTLALGAAVPPIIRLLPAVYPGSIDVATITSVPLRYVASGATIAAQHAVRIQDGASAEVRGLRGAGTSSTVYCRSATSTKSSLKLQDTVLTAGDGGASLVYREKCALTMIGGELDIGSSTGSSVLMLGEASFVADRVHVHGSKESSIGASFAAGIFVRITNSVLENIRFQWATSDAGPPGSLIEMGFNTIVGNLNCQTNSGSAYRTSRYQNNIVVSPDAASAVNGTDCTLSNNVLFPFSGSLGTNLVADPQFEDRAARIYRLKATSPAIDAAVPTTALPATADFAGVSRPQGALPDIGAFERAP